MWVEIFSALFTALSALVVGIALYRRENAGRTRFVIFVALAPVVNFILNITLPHYISVGAFVLTASVLCSATILQIIQKQVYIGNMVQGQRQVVSFKGTSKN